MKSNLPENPLQLPDISESLKQGIRIVPVELEKQMKSAYLDYAMSVIVGRALPDVRDGLKPVHRRILYAMHERAWRHDRPFVKCAKIVGEVIGNYHPHGDMAVYETLVRMAQDFVMNVPLIEGQGNFGSIDGDNPAAYRYTEARLTLAAEELLRDIDKNTVDFVPNFDDTREEPVVLPAGIPNLLINGSSGIAVGMATNIPPHNPVEVIRAVNALIDNPNISIKELMKIIPAPDFPTGGIIIGDEGLKAAYTQGKGSIKIRAKIEEEEDPKRKRKLLVIKEIPYQVSKKAILEKIGELVQEKVIEGIIDIKDLSDRNGIRVEIELKKDINIQVVLNQLYKMTQLQVSYGIIFLALVDGQPKILNLKEILTEYIKHRKQVVYRRTQYELDEAEKRAHILEGLKVALDFIDEVIKIIRSSKTVQEAKENLMQRFQLTEIQANAILDMRLQKLTSLERQKILEELEELKKKIEDYKDILSKESRQYQIIKEELNQALEKIQKNGAKRLTEISGSSDVITTFDITDLIHEEDVIISITNDGFIKRTNIDTFKRQKRGGKGIKSTNLKEEDTIRLLYHSSTHETLLLFSNRGKVFALKVYEIPDSTKESRGKSLKALLNLAQEEMITSVCSVKAFPKDHSLVMITKKGILKKTNLEIFKNATKKGIMAIQLREDDELMNVIAVDPKNEIIIATKMGLALRTNISKMKDQGRNASGIIGMRLSDDDVIIGMDILKKGQYILVVSENGYGKLMEEKLFSTKGRGGKGIHYMKITEKTGHPVAIKSLNRTDDIFIIQSNGKIIRLSAEEVSVQGRSASGIKLIDVPQGEDSDEKVVDVAVVSSSKK
ncbi:MAG: DNA gyrase subunit A [Leptospiraceae bacterium]|nr:DNA gyrase subunit A [Leptospiraceae bacterium]MDW7976113.1 DNA gyrase subunit A [Leptospiraceae bacterium]